MDYFYFQNEFDEEWGGADTRLLVKVGESKVNRILGFLNTLSVMFTRRIKRAKYRIIRQCSGEVNHMNILSGASDMFVGSRAYPSSRAVIEETSSER